jgi:DNA (cytosine-5)-methyltransferase 1
VKDVSTMGALCAGVGGLEMGIGRALGAKTIWQVEIEPHLRAVLAETWPAAERFDDVKASGGYFVWRNVLCPVDLICFGSPCQDVSSAGKRLGLDGPESRLFYECARIVGELSPEWVVFENVASGACRWVDAVRQELEQLGYATLPDPLSASDCGAPHPRARVFIIAHADSAELRQQSGGAAGRTGATRHSLESLAKLCPPLALPTLTTSRSTYQRRRGVTYLTVPGLALAESVRSAAEQPSQPDSLRPESDVKPALLPTLTASSATRGAAVRGKKAQGGPSLQEMPLPTLCSRDEKCPGPAHTKSGVDLPQTVGRHLSPTFCEWYMGFPPGHTLPIQRWLEEQDALKRARRESESRLSATLAPRSKRKPSDTSSESSSRPSAGETHDA